MQPRDLSIIDAVHRHRVLSAPQIAALFFPTAHGGVSSQCRYRLRMLAQAGLLEKKEQPQTLRDGRRPYVYFLTSAGCRLLVDELGYEPADLDWKPSFNDIESPYLAHQLALGDVYVAIHLGAARAGWTVREWVDDRFLRKLHTDRVRIEVPGGGAEDVAVVPDGYLVLSVPDDPEGQERWLSFFIEIDRATEVVAATHQQRRTWRRRIRAYQAYFESPAIVERYHTRNIRVLTVTTSPKRLENLRAATAAEGGRSRYWFTTIDALSATTVLEGPIWHKADGGDPVALMK